MMRELWKPCSEKIAKLGLSVYGSMSFDVEIKAVPPNYLMDKLDEWIQTQLPNLFWKDELGSGSIGLMDMEPLQSLLKTDSVMVSGTKIQTLLSGTYRRFANYIQTLSMKFAGNPRYLDECDQAILFRWESASHTAINKKARSILKRLADATAQLPEDRAGVVHIGFEALENSEVEHLRYKKIIETAATFDPKDKPLSYLYCHYLVPESPLDECWAYDETTQWIKMSETVPMPIKNCFLVIPESEDTREGVHWSMGA